MIPRRFLLGLDADDFDIPGVFGVTHARKPGSWRIICSYADGKRHKARLFASMAAHGQSEKRGEWDLHHVVEGQHYADVDFSVRFAAMYRDELPCVLITKNEHVGYNQLLHIRETDELYRDQQLPADLLARSAAAAKAARLPANHAELHARVQSLLRLYRDAYMGDDVLITIARNVLTDALSHIR